MPIVLSYGDGRPGGGGMKIVMSAASRHQPPTVMKQVVSICLFALFFTGSSLARQSDDSRQRLYVELPGLQLVTDTGRYVRVGCTRCWTPYLGTTRLSEPEYFHVAGQPELAARAKRAKRRKIGALALGGASMIAGGILVASGAGNVNDGVMASPGRLAGGGLLIAFGSGAASFSALSLTRRHAPYTMAEAAAREYNMIHFGELDR